MTSAGEMVSEEQKIIANRGFSFPLPFPFTDVEVLDEYLDYLEGAFLSLHHLALSEIERTELEAWAETCRDIEAEEEKSAAGAAADVNEQI